MVAKWSTKPYPSADDRLALQFHIELARGRCVFEALALVAINGVIGVGVDEAVLFADAGVIVITAFISPYRSDRVRARI